MTPNNHNVLSNQPIDSGAESIFISTPGDGSIKFVYSVKAISGNVSVRVLGYLGNNSVVLQTAQTVDAGAAIVQQLDGEAYERIGIGITGSGGAAVVDVSVNWSTYKD